MRALIACRTGMGSSMMLKIKVNQVIKENDYPLELVHGTLSDVKSFNGDLLITMDDVADELKGEFKEIIGIKNLMDKVEIKEKIGKFLENK